MTWGIGVQEESCRWGLLLLLSAAGLVQKIVE